MTRYQLQCFATLENISLKPFYLHFEKQKKHHWRDFMRLTPRELERFFPQCEEKFVYLYPFGCIVFVNFSSKERETLLDALSMVTHKKIVFNTHTLSESYAIEIAPALSHPTPMNHTLLTPLYRPHMLDLIAQIMSKSVAMDRIEHRVDTLLIECQEVLNHMKLSCFTLDERKIYRLSGEILELKFTALSTIRLLEKPAITWKRDALDTLYSDLEKQFEIRSRYEILHNKYEALHNIVKNFTSLSQESHSSKLIWIVILLIAATVLIEFVRFYF